MLDPSRMPLLHYYNLGDTYTSGEGGMRYRLARAQETDDAGESRAVIEAVVWQGPWCFDRTADALKTAARYPYTQDGLDEAAAWIVQQYADRRAFWDAAPSVKDAPPAAPETPDHTAQR